ncbi:hypothetical protein THER5_1955 [Bifidobacterium thermacidophilum subsp. thermacidophilum]|uniref:Uncharacterized protein n=1 Tax=Bifidobacterium thermacidophilum subsp. thermacidophilum TaxID=79262 RepID=A0A087E8Y2_9BIFI|nr:hypothetical protein THER5_1955 [Bifidobacterium thermacidophilum subsp. thermacidophilum]
MYHAYVANQPASGRHPPDAQQTSHTPLRRIRDQWPDKPPARLSDETSHAPSDSETNSNNN